MTSPQVAPASMPLDRSRLKILGRDEVPPAPHLLGPGIRGAVVASPEQRFDWFGLCAGLASAVDPRAGDLRLP